MTTEDQIRDEKLQHDDIDREAGKSISFIIRQN